MKKLVYISGAVSDIPERVYKARFKKAEKFLLGLGYDVFNPIEDEEIQTVFREYGYSACLAKCIEKLQYCDMIFMLVGFTESGGAMAEKAYAKACKMEIVYECSNNYGE